MSDTIIIGGGAATPSNILVNVDHETIEGDGSLANPLHAVSTPAGGGTFKASFHQASSPPAVGMPVFVSFFAPAPGTLATVAQASIDPASVPPGNPDPGFLLSFSSAIGVIEAINGDGTVQVQGAGFFTLSTGEWDVLTGGSGGLAFGEIYYVAFSSQDAHLLRNTKINQAGFMSVRVGIAVSATTMLLSPQEPVQILGDSILFPGTTGSATVGMAVFSTVTPVRFDAAIATNATEAQVVGIVTSLLGPVVQFQGVVTLTAAQWTAVTGDVGGLQAGDVYWLSATTAGHLTKTKPTASGTFAVQVGVAISATQLVMTGILPVLNP